MPFDAVHVLVQRFAIARDGILTVAAQGRCQLQIVDFDTRRRTQRRGALQNIFEFAHVPGIGIGGKRGHRRLADTGRLVLAQARQGRADQRWNVLETFAQGRHLQLDDVKPVIEVLPKAPGIDTFLEPLVRGRDDAHIDRFFTGTTDLAYFLFLYRTQQFDLHRQGQIGDFVKEQGAPVRRLEEPIPVDVRARKRPFAVTEEFTFHQVFRNRPTVDRNERRRMPCALRMDEACRKFLTATGLSRDVNRCLTPRQFGDHFAHPGNRR